MYHGTVDSQTVHILLVQLVRAVQYKVLAYQVLYHSIKRSEQAAPDTDPMFLFCFVTRIRLQLCSQFLPVVVVPFDGRPSPFEV